jgi:hypothetical protein
METPEATPPPSTPPGRARSWLGTGGAGVPTLGLPDVLWFFGAISAVAAALAIVHQVHGTDRHVWQFLVALGFLAGFALAAWVVARGAGRLPGGIAAGMAVVMVPAAG